MWNIVSRNSVRLNIYACAALEAEASWTAGDNGDKSKDGRSAGRMEERPSQVTWQITVSLENMGSGSEQSRLAKVPRGRSVRPSRESRSDAQLSRSGQAAENCGP